MSKYKITFSEEIKNRIRSDYDAATAYFAERKEEITAGVESLEEPEKLLAQYLYAYMPLSDIGAYSFEVNRSYAGHGAFLLEHSPFLEGVSEAYFFQYVLSHRINSEDITECRRFFYDKTIDRVKGMNRKEAALELNNWCYEQATYRSTSLRTASPMTVYRGGFGRCGEESTFLTSVLRSVGIPARQVYVPRWSHSDDNHAWVEIFCEDGWFYTGACEPQPVMNNGWFPYAASRAMIAHTRVFGNLEEGVEEITEQDGCCALVNQGKRYAHTVPFTLKVKDKDGRPLAGATVRFEIINSAEFFPVAVLDTDAEGVCRLSMGQGSIHLHVLYEGKSMSVFANVRESQEAEIVFGETTPEGWTSYHLVAPESAVVSSVDMTPEQAAYQDKRNEEGARIRQARLDSYYDEAFAEQWKGYKNTAKVLEQSKGNFAEIRSFLEKDYPNIGKAEKDMLLGVISQKDCRDITEEVLADALSAFDFRDEYPEEVFTWNLLAQRIHHETATPYRAYLRERFAGRAEEIREDPMALWNCLEKEIGFYPEKEYHTIYSVPKSACEMKAATPVSRAILFIAVLRSFGIPARFDRVYMEPQYYMDGSFRYVHREFEKRGTLVLTNHEEKKPDYYSQFTVGRRQEDGSYCTLHLWEHKFQGDAMTVKLAPGEYRIVTSDRTSTGDVLGRSLIFRIREGEEATFELECIQLKKEDLMHRTGLPAFTVKEREGKSVDSSAVCGEETGILIFGEPGKEPTEHVFNELLEIKKMNGFPKCRLNLILQNSQGLADPTLKKVTADYPDMKIWYGDFEAVLPELEKLTQVSIKNLPYICVTQGSRESLWCVSGYNVGCVDVLARLVKE